MSVKEVDVSHLLVEYIWIELYSKEWFDTNSVYCSSQKSYFKNENQMTKHLDNYPLDDNYYYYLKDIESNKRIYKIKTEDYHRIWGAEEIDITDYPEYRI